MTDRQTDRQADVAVSIIIPHYNSVILLRKLLLSIPDRDWIQVIVVDDHSDKLLDEYEAVKQEFSRDRGYLFLENPEKYAGTARNHGMKYSTGKWLMFADSDDYFTEDFEKIICRHLDDEEDLICFTPTSVNIDEPDKKCYRHLHYQRIVEDCVVSPSDVHEHQLRYSYWAPWSKLIRRSVVISNGIQFEASKHSNDILFSAKCGAYACKIKAVDETIYCVTKNSNSITQQRNEEDQKIRDREYDKYIWWIKCHIGLNGRRAMGWSWATYLNIIHTHYKKRIKNFLNREGNL